MKKILFILLVFSSLIACGKKKTTESATTYTHPEWAYNATIYEVNTRQFTPEGTFHAFAAHLPRLSGLGVDILWFMPLQPIGEKERKGTLGSYYSIRDYTGINSEFGTLEDFKNVIKQAHDVGMKVILDWVANHTSRDAVWVDAHPDWYAHDSLGNIVAPYDWTDVAKLNYYNADMRAAMIQSMLFWVREADIDGFRCDVAGEVPTDFWETAVDSLKAVNPELFMLAEAEKPELNNNAFDAYYAWDFHHKMNLVAQGKENVDSLRASLKRMNDRFPKTAIPMYFTSNHDENSWNGTEFERMGDAVKTFAALSYMLPGMPLIYNGQEAGFNRRLQFFEKDSIDWADNDGFTAFYQLLNRFRKDNLALFSLEKGGDFEEISNNQPQSVWSFKRVKNGNEVVCAFNLSAKEIAVAFDNAIPSEGFSSFPANTIATPKKEIRLAPWEYRVFYRNGSL